MAANLKNLAEQVRKSRQKRGLTKSDLLSAVPLADMSDIDRLESAEDLPRRDVLEAIASVLSIHEKHWRPLIAPPSSKRKEFELALEELVGRPVNLEALDGAGAAAADHVLNELLTVGLTADQSHALFNRLLVFYGVAQTSKEFFDHYLGPRAFTSDARFRESVKWYQIDAIRLFSSFSEAYERLNRERSRRFSRHLLSAPTSTIAPGVRGRQSPRSKKSVCRSSATYQRKRCARRVKSEPF